MRFTSWSKGYCDDVTRSNAWSLRENRLEEKKENSQVDIVKLQKDMRMLKQEKKKLDGAG